VREGKHGARSSQQMICDWPERSAASRNPITTSQTWPSEREHLEKCET
jgi:hypothetical protein